MSDMLEGVKVTITAFVDDYPPGIVGFEFADVDGRVWKFEMKFYDVSDDELDVSSLYPRPGVLGCDSVARMTDGKGRAIAEIETNWDSVEGESRFCVFADQLTEEVTACFVSRKRGEPIPLISVETIVVTAEKKKT